ncbi:MAG: hypothetical protein M3275_07460 [Thermoproteota archaeon]|jgi:hypothetical protein|nr:hypothetical protein [Thermoproteota archaeon]
MTTLLNTLTTVTAASVLFGLALVPLTSPSMAQQQQTTTDTTNTTMTPSTNGTTTGSLQDFTNNQTATAQIDRFTITQQWSPRLFINPDTAELSYASCSEGQVVIGGGYQVSSPEVRILFSGPSLTVNAYGVQAYNDEDIPSFLKVYALCVGGTGQTPGQPLETQEGS